jgi:hypothetical protein
MVFQEDGKDLCGCDLEAVKSERRRVNRAQQRGSDLKNVKRAFSPFTILTSLFHHSRLLLHPSPTQ